MVKKTGVKKTIVKVTGVKEMEKNKVNGKEKKEKPEKNDILYFLKKLNNENYRFKFPTEKCKLALIKAIEEMCKFDDFIGILNHTFRVIGNALLLAEKEKLKAKDKEIVFLSAIFHDVYKRDVGKHAIKGALFSKKILKELNYPDDVCNDVYTAIIVHTESFLKPQKITEKILYDADKLDKIGACGILRRATNMENWTEEKIIKKLKEDINQKFYLTISKKIAEEKINNEKEILNFD